MTEEVAKLRNQVFELQQLVKRQSVILAKTGQSVMELQIDQQKTDISNLNVESKPEESLHLPKHENIDPAEFATNGDLEQLVEELQGQLAVSYTHLDVYKRQGLLHWV